MAERIDLCQNMTMQDSRKKSGWLAATGKGGPRWADPEDSYLEQTENRRSGKAEQRPRKRAFVTHYYALGTLALLLAGAAVAGGVWHLRQAAPKEAGLEEQSLQDPLTPLSQKVREALLDPKPELSAELKRASWGGLAHFARSSAL